MTTQETSGPFVRKMFSAIAGRYDFANHFLSFGWDFFWRRRTAGSWRGSKRWMGQ